MEDFTDVFQQTWYAYSGGPDALAIGWRKAPPVPGTYAYGYPLKLITFTKKTLMFAEEGPYYGPIPEMPQKKK